MDSFRQTSSITRRLRSIIIALAVFLLLEFAGTLVASQAFFAGLKELKRINTVTALATQITDNLTAARVTLDKAANGPLETAAQSIPVYEKSFSEVRSAFDLAIRLSAEGEERRLLVEGSNAAAEFDRTARRAYSGLNAPKHGSASALKKDLLLVRQFEIDVIEGVRQAQIQLGRSGDALFQSLYTNRYTPVVVALLLAAIFFAFVLYVGLSTTRRLSGPLDNLLAATDQVARGDLTARAPVLAEDEVGHLTHGFNLMVSKLERSVREAEVAAERTVRLQNVTAEFSKALEPLAVSRVVVEQGMQSLGANTGAVYVPSKDGSRLETLARAGYDLAVGKKFPSLPIGFDTPANRAYQTLTPLFLESHERIFAEFPDIEGIRGFHAQSLAALPLMAHGKAIGVLTFTFHQERMLAREDREFLTALSSLAAQALQRAMLYEDAQTAIRVRDEFLSIASHELKTPLTSLKLQLQMASRQVKPAENVAPPPEKLARMFSLSSAQVDRLTSLVEDLLDVARIEAGKLSFHFDLVDMRELITDVAERSSDMFRATGCTLEISAEPGIQVQCDRFRIEQVVINLLSNATKYGAGKPVRMKLTRERGFAKIEVRDQGIGIPNDRLDRIFDRFERAVSGRNISGLGLGLYIVRQIVEGHQGRITVQSEPGIGSVFTVDLPVLEKPRDAGLPA